MATFEWIVTCTECGAKVDPTYDGLRECECSDCTVNACETCVDSELWSTDPAFCAEHKQDDA